MVDNAESPQLSPGRSPQKVWLERLLARAQAAGERTSRKEIVAALVATSNQSDAQLGKILRKYRTVTVRQILPYPMMRMSSPSPSSVLALAQVSGPSPAEQDLSASVIPPR